ncbi:glycosyltransferase 61 family protein [Nocardioides sp. 503]|uniref:glycosyltransferase family 61 protein n=1 Tax=Nocardioides sp. 503 TaxID=2508326 RepID=UPI00106F9146|nr:glycosyltransferase 61 family protein [Nocardioides sp. 503]
MARLARPEPTAADRLEELEDADLAVALCPLLLRLGERPAPAVAVVADVADPPIARALLEVWPQARLTVLDPAVGDSDLHVALAAAGSFDAIFDLADERGARSRQILFHLRRGGLLVVMDARAEGARAAETALTAVRSSLLPDDVLDPDDLHLARAVESVTVRGDHLVLSANPRGRPYLAKLREEEVDAYLEATDGRVGRVLTSRPGSVVVNPAPVVVSESESAMVYKTTFRAPPLRVREYDRAECRVGQVLCTDNVVLPDTYRHNFRARLNNRFTVPAAPRFAQTKGPDPADLDGTWFYLDSEFRGHFGHAMTEQLSRLWAWEEAKAAHPDLRALVLVNGAHTTIAEWEYRLYEAAGVRREDLVLLDGPVRPERLLAVTPAFSQPGYVHEAAREVYDRVGDDLAADAPSREYADRIFCSRRHEKRSATNPAEVEEFFARRGFEIVYPEDYPLGEQVQMFRSATELAGFAGSAMFSMAFVREPKRVTLVSAETYFAQNEGLFAAMRGHQLNVAWCRAHRHRPDGTLIKKKLHATFTFDDAREGEFLRRILDA